MVGWHSILRTISFRCRLSYQHVHVQYGNHLKSRLPVQEHTKCIFFHKSARTFILPVLGYLSTWDEGHIQWRDTYSRIPYSGAWEEKWSEQPELSGGNGLPVFLRCSKVVWVLQPEIKTETRLPLKWATDVSRPLGVHLTLLDLASSLLTRMSI